MEGTTENNGTRSCKYYRYEGNVPENIIKEFETYAPLALEKNHYDLLLSRCKDTSSYKKLQKSYENVLDNFEPVSFIEIGSKYQFDKALMSSCLYSNPSLISSTTSSGMFSNSNSKLTENGVASVSVSSIAKDKETGEYSFNIVAVVTKGDEDNLTHTTVAFKVDSPEEDVYKAFIEGRASVDSIVLTKNGKTYTVGYVDVDGLNMGNN